MCLNQSSATFKSNVKTVAGWVVVSLEHYHWKCIGSNGTEGERTTATRIQSKTQTLVYILSYASFKTTLCSNNYDVYGYS